MSDHKFPEPQYPRLAGFADQRGPAVPAGSSAWSQQAWAPEPTLIVENSFSVLEGVDKGIHQWLRDQLVILTSSPNVEGWSPPASDDFQQWDGKIRFYEARNDSGRFQTGLVSSVQSLLTRCGIRPVVLDRRSRPESGVPETDASPQPLRDYQIAAVEAAERAGRGVWVMPPRAGKTRCGIEWCRRIAVPTIWVAPTKNLVTQTVRAFEAALGRNYAIAHAGSDWKPVAHANVIVTTYDTARSLPGEFWRTRQAIVVDECHHAASDTFKLINRMIPHVFYRLGMSGTFFRSNGDDLAMHAFLSDVLYEVTSSFLVERGYLVPASVAIVPVPETERFRAADHHEVVKRGIVTHEFRQAAAAWAAAVCVSRGMKAVVLVAQKQQGDDLTKRIEALLPSAAAGAEFGTVEFVSTNRPAATINRVLRAFTEGSNVKVLIGTSMIGEGTDLPPADALIYAFGGKAEVGHRQAAYRVCTADGRKRRAVIVDFADRHHRSLLEHSVDRTDHYLDEKTFTTTVLERLDYLPGWLDWSLSSR